MLFSCHQKPVNNINKNTGTVGTDSLVNRAKKFQDVKVDSLLPISKQLQIIAKANNDKKALVYGEYFASFYYWMSADHRRSMAEAINCLANAERYGIRMLIPAIYQVIGNLQKENTNYKMAFEAQEKGLKQARINHDTTHIIALLNLRAMFIHSQRLHNNDTSAHDTSINIQLATLKLAESSVKYEKQCVPLYDNIAQYYLNNKNYDRSIFYGNKGADNALKYNMQRSLTYSYSWLGEAYYFKGDKQKGLDYIRRALAITIAIDEPYRQMEIYDHLYECYNRSGDYKAALSSILRSHAMRDSLQLLVNEKQINELQIKYESAKKDNAIAKMGQNARAKNREIIIALTCSLLFVIFFIILFLQYRILKQNNQTISKSNARKDKALENIAYIQAHELRKPLASIMGLVTLIKETEYLPDEKWQSMLDDACTDLDTKIRSIIIHVEEDSA